MFNQRALRHLIAAVPTSVMLLLGGGALTTSAQATTWLCRPGLQANPCTPGLSTTVFSPFTRPLAVRHPAIVRRPAFDCFYVYPTVSDQSTRHANLHVDPEERSIALYQAARYSQLCRVFAPMYRQVTVPYLERTGNETVADLALPLNDVRAAFKDFLRRYSKGRPFVLIGHSQGSFLLRELISQDIDSAPALRRRLVSAILLGGNVLVRRGSDVGGDFQHIPGCSRPGQLSCVIAFSTFDQPAPTGSLFGVSAKAKYAVLCTDPTVLSRSQGLLDPILPSQPFAPGTLIAAGINLLGITQPTPSTVWSTEPGSFSARCTGGSGAHVLEISPQSGAPTPKPSPTPVWGLHLLDANAALGNLLTILRADGRTLSARRP